MKIDNTFERRSYLLLQSALRFEGGKKLQTDFSLPAYNSALFDSANVCLSFWVLVDVNLQSSDVVFRRGAGGATAQFTFADLGINVSSFQGRWLHIVASPQSSNDASTPYDVYINSVYKLTTSARDFKTTNDNLIIGSDVGGTTEFLIAFFTAFNTPLNQGGIDSLYSEWGYVPDGLAANAIWFPAFDRVTAFKDTGDIYGFGVGVNVFFDYSFQFNKQKATAITEPSHVKAVGFTDDDLGVVNKSSQTVFKEFYNNLTYKRGCDMNPTLISTGEAKYQGPLDLTVPSIGQVEGGSYTAFLSLRCDDRYSYTDWFGVGGNRTITAINLSGLLADLSDSLYASGLVYDFNGLNNPAFPLRLPHYNDTWNIIFVYDQISGKMKNWLYNTRLQRTAYIEFDFTWTYLSSFLRITGLGVGKNSASARVHGGIINTMFFYANTVLTDNQAVNIVEGNFSAVPSKTLEYIGCDESTDVLFDLTGNGNHGSFVTEPAYVKEPGGGHLLEIESELPLLSQALDLENGGVGGRQFTIDDFDCNSSDMWTGFWVFKKIVT